MSAEKDVIRPGKAVAPLAGFVRSLLFARQKSLFSAGLGGLIIAGAVLAAAPAALRPDGLFSAIGTVATDNAYVQGDITPISPKISGYVTEVPIRDNQEVNAGDVLFRIDARDYQARVNQAAAGLATHRAGLANLASRIAYQQAVIERVVAIRNGAAANQERASRDFERIRDLAVNGWASQAKRDLAEADHLQASARVSEAQADLAAARRQLDVLETQRPQLQADIDAASAALRLAEIDLEDTVVRAPADGRVGERQVRRGQYVRPGTLVLAIVPMDVWVVANFKETQIPHLNVGDVTRVLVDAVPGVVFGACVQSIAPASGAKFALLPPDNATGNFTRIAQRIPVKITFLPGQPALANLRPGMSAVVKVRSTGPGARQRDCPGQARHGPI